MICLDIGNTKTAIGYFKDGALERSWKISTVRHRLKDDYLLLLQQLVPQAFTNETFPMIVSSVVPSATKELAKIKTPVSVHFVDYRTPKSFEVALELPNTLGPDRIADTEAAVHAFGAPVIIVDAGTATTVSAINAKKQFVGGAICPGLGISTEALFKSAAALSQISIQPTTFVIGNSTEKALQSGLCFGHAFMIIGLVDAMKRELGTDSSCPVVITGGSADFLSSALPSTYHLDANLTLKGLQLLSGRILKADKNG